MPIPGYEDLCLPLEPTVFNLENVMKIFYYILFLLFASHSSYALEYSCIDKKHGNLSKMTVEGEFVKYEDQNGEPLEYKIVENSEIPSCNLITVALYLIPSLLNLSVQTLTVCFSHTFK